MIVLRGKQLVCKALLIHWEFLEGLSECVWRWRFLLSSSIRLNQPLALQLYKTRVKRHLRRCFLCREYSLSGTSFQLGGFASPPSSTSSLPPLFLPSFVFFSSLLPPSFHQLFSFTFLKKFIPFIILVVILMYLIVCLDYIQESIITRDCTAHSQHPMYWVAHGETAGEQCQASKSRANAQPGTVVHCSCVMPELL